MFGLDDVLGADLAEFLDQKPPELQLTG
jgi:hypothetical protein